MDLNDFTQIKTAAYSTRVVLFLDILGFRELIRRTENDQRLISQLAHVFLSMRETSSPSDSATARVLFNDTRIFSHFSDCMVVTSGPNPQSVVDLLNRVRICQIEALPYGILIRGAVTIGEVYHTEETPTRSSLLFGPAMMDAYEMENKEAKYPRVIVAPEVMELVSNLSHPCYIDCDEWPFVNYLRKDAAVEEAVKSSFRNPFSRYESFREYAAVIEQHYSGWRSIRDIGIRTKHSWMLRQLNFGNEA